MGFDSEADMKVVAKEVLDSSFTGGPTTTIEEFSYGAGRADLVLAKESDAYRQHRLNVLGINSAIDHDAYLRTFLLLHNRKEISKDYFYKVGALDKRTKTEALDWLTNSGFIEELPGNKIRTAPHLRRHITRSYSIELKLENWRKAVKQAFRGKSFSDYQFVAIDDENIIRAIDNIDIFEKYHIGLISINTDHGYFVHHAPERQTPYSPLNKWKLNETTIWEETPRYISSD